MVDDSSTGPRAGVHADSALAAARRASSPGCCDGRVSRTRRAGLRIILQHCHFNHSSAKPRVSAFEWLICTVSYSEPPPLSPLPPVLRIRNMKRSMVRSMVLLSLVMTWATEPGLLHPVSSDGETSAVRSASQCSGCHRAAPRPA